MQQYCEVALKQLRSRKAQKASKHNLGPDIFSHGRRTPDPLSLVETSPLSSNSSRLSKPLDRRSRSIDNQSRSYNRPIQPDPSP
ncbi:hypothetical protein GQ457_07G006160 [Hibiscus cannabinus]